MDKLKALFQGKRGKWFLIAAGVVALLAFISFRRSQSGGGANLTEYPTYQQPQTPDGAAGGADAEMLVGELSRQMGEQFERQEEQQMQIVEQFNTSLANTQTAFSQMFSSYTEANAAQIDTLSDSFNSAMLASDAKNAAQLATLTEGFNAALLAAAEQKVGAGSQSPIVDDNPGGYSSVPVGISEPARATPNKSSSSSSSRSSGSSSGRSTRTIAAPAKTNQQTYLEKTREQAKASGNTGLQKWANQSLYLENLKKSGNAGEKKWADAELKKLYKTG